MKLETIDVGKPEIVERLAAEFPADVDEVDGWLNVWDDDGTVFKAPGPAAVA